MFERKTSTIQIVECVNAYTKWKGEMTLDSAPIKQLFGDR